MSDPRVVKLAKLLTNYCVAVQPGERVIINGSCAGYPLVKETYRQVIRAGGHPMIVLLEDDIDEILYKEGNDDQIQFIPDPMRLTLETYECRIAIRGARNTRSLNGVDPARQRLRQQASKELMAISMRRSAAGELRWVGTLYPTAAHAQDADMSLGEFEDFVYGACHVDKDDPVAEWRKISAEQQRLVDWLAGKERVKVRGPSVDLTLSVAGRTFINADGTNNMPSGEIFTGPVEESVNGWVRFSYPAIVAGREVMGVELRFEEGKVVQATAEKNEEFLLTALDSDDGARYLGEFAIGTNYGIDRFTKSILYDEKIGGTIHMALGAGYPQTGSKNISSLHWDMICEMRDGGQIWVDDELFYDSGEFKV
ncbi:MAG TPA: aminopeptidase [Anaerolineae bacterium]|nr:aminopeptidase [Anaerolineae bacterium]